MRSKHKNYWINYKKISATCWVSLSCFLFFIPQLIGQQSSFSGLIFDDTAYAAIPTVPKYTGVKADNTPPKINLKPYFPTPKDQGEISSCVGWAVGYGALTAYRAIQNNISASSLINQRANSALFLYNQITPKQNQCQVGAKITDALHLLKTKGDCLYREFDEFVQCPTLPASDLKKRAVRYQIKDYFSLFDIAATASLKILKTKESLAKKKPVIVGLNITADFSNLQNTDTLWQPKTTTLTGGHAMVVVGYDDINKRFELMNSSGTNWGNEGFIWMDYQDYAKMVKYGFQLSLKDKEKNKFALQGELSFKYPYDYKTDEQGYRLNDDNGCPIYLFKDAKVSLDKKNAVYALSKKYSKIGTSLQLIATQIPSDNYLYVFGVSPKNELITYFPRGQASNIITSQEAFLVVPGTCKAIKISEPGKQYIYALISREEQKDLFKNLSELKNKDFISPQKIKRYFGNRVVAPNQMNLNPIAIAGIQKGAEATALLFVIEIDAL